MAEDKIAHDSHDKKRTEDRNGDLKTVSEEYFVTKTPAARKLKWPISNRNKKFTAQLLIGPSLLMPILWNRQGHF